MICLMHKLGLISRLNYTTHEKLVVRMMQEQAKKREIATSEIATATLLPDNLVLPEVPSWLREREPVSAR
jgi:hypothetical protein